MQYDLWIRGGTVVDGSGAARQRADVAIKHGNIAAVAPPGEAAASGATREIDASGMIVAPGLSVPLFSAASIIDSAMRSLIEPPGLARSDLTHTWCVSPNRRLMRMCGVLPMVARLLSAFLRSPWTENEPA